MSTFSKWMTRSSIALFALGAVACGGENGLMESEAPVFAAPDDDTASEEKGGVGAAKQAIGEFCGGIAGIECPDGSLCVDDPNDDCNPSSGGADCGGVCIAKIFCGGFAGIECPGKKYVCVDDPTDDCDPASGGADCGGVCVPRPRK
jgi:hypothetical protein